MFLKWKTTIELVLTKAENQKRKKKGEGSKTKWNVLKLKQNVLKSKLINLTEICF